jgi:hypothetical protein
MSTSRLTPESSTGDSQPNRFLQMLGDAARFWEPRRIAYNSILVGVVAAWVAATWPHFRPALTLEALGIMTVLALLANLCYCAAYFVDIPMQLSAVGADWRRSRWILWIAGMILAFVFTNYWIADEIYPFIR